MRSIQLIVVFSLIWGSASAQTTATGIFLSIKCARNIPKQYVVLTSKSICLAQNPIITIEDFESVTEVKQAEGQIYFDITFSQKAVQRLSQITSNLPNSQLALVIDKEVFSAFEAGNTQVSKTFRFQSAARDQQLFFTAQEKLKASIKGAP